MAEYYQPKGFTKSTDESTLFGSDRININKRVIYPHGGDDWKATRKTPIPAAADGEVTMTPWDKSGFGHYIVLKHKNPKNIEVVTIYGHMDEPSPLAVGSQVKKGDIVGYSGQTGNATGYHMHFEIRERGFYGGDPVDPSTYDLSQLKSTTPAAQPETHTNTEQGANDTANTSETDATIDETSQSKPAIDSICTVSACTEEQFIVQIIGKDHPTGQRIYITDEKGQEIAQQPEKEKIEQTDATTLSILHKWDWEKHKNKQRNAYLEIATTEGKPIQLNLINNADITEKQTDQQIHQIVPIVPCTIVKGIKSSQDSGVPVIARSGFFYIFENSGGKTKLWREVQIITKDNSTTVYKDIPIQDEKYYQQGKYQGGIRKATGVELKEIWIPNFWSIVQKNNTQAYLERKTYNRFFYSEIQLSAARLNKILSKGNIERPYTYVQPTSLNINTQSFKNLPLKGKKLLDSYKDLDVGYQTWQNYATAQGDVAVKNLLLNCYPATAIAPHRQRDVDLELLLIHPANYLYDLENTYFKENKQLADTFLANAKQGNKTQKKHRIEFTALLPKIQSQLTTKKVDSTQSNFGEKSTINTLVKETIVNITESIGQINNAPQDISQDIGAGKNILQDAHDRQICCITVEDHHYHTRQLTASILIAHELLGASVALATQQKYFDSAILVQRLICPQYLGNKLNPLHEHLQKLDQYGLKQLAVNSCAHERGLATDQYNKSQSKLLKTFTDKNSPYFHIWVDHLSQDPKELYTPAYNNLVTTLGTLSTNIAHVDPFNSDGYIVIGNEYLGGYDKTLNKSITAYITDMSQILNHPMHQLLFSDLDKEALKKPYVRPQKLVENDGTGKARLHLLAEFRKTSGNIIADEYTQISYDAKLIGDLIKSGSVSDLANGSAKAFAGIIGMMGGTLQGFIENAVKQLKEDEQALAEAQGRLSQAQKNVQTAQQNQETADTQAGTSKQTLDQATRQNQTADTQLEQAKQQHQQTTQQIGGAETTAQQTAGEVNQRTNQVQTDQHEVTIAQGQTTQANQQADRANRTATDSAQVSTEYGTRLEQRQTASTQAGQTANTHINNAIRNGQGLANIELYTGVEVPVWQAVLFQRTREVMQGTPIENAFISTLIRRRQGTSATQRMTLVHVNYRAPNGITAQRLFGEIIDEAIDPQTGQTNTTTIGTTRQTTARGAGLSTASKTDYPVIVAYEDSPLAQSMRQIEITNQQLQQAANDYDQVSQIAEEDQQALNQARARQQAAQSAEQSAQQQLRNSQQSLDKAIEADNRAQTNLKNLRAQQGADKQALANAEAMATAAKSNLAKAQAAHTANIAKQQQAAQELVAANGHYNQVEAEVQQRQQTANASKAKTTTLQNNRLAKALDSTSVKAAVLAFQGYNLYQSYQAITQARNTENLSRSIAGVALSSTDVLIAFEDLAVKLYPERSKITFMRKELYRLDASKLPAIFREGSVLARKTIVTRLMFSQVVLGVIGAGVSAYDLYYSISLNENSTVIGAGVLSVIGGLITAFSPYLVGTAGTFLLINPIGWVGIIIAAIALAVAYWYSSNDIELWLVNGPFGNPNATGSKLDYLKDPVEAYYQLVNLFAAIKIATRTKDIRVGAFAYSADEITVTSQLQGLLGNTNDLTVNAAYSRILSDTIPASFSKDHGYPKILPDGMVYLVDNKPTGLAGGSFSLQVRAQFKTKYRGHDFYFPAPKIKDKISYQAAAEYPINLDKTGQPFWADQSDNK